jgi:hypothetical protein
VEASYFNDHFQKNLNFLYKMHFFTLVLPLANIFLVFTKGGHCGRALCFILSCIV